VFVQKNWKSKGKFPRRATLVFIFKFWKLQDVQPGNERFIFFWAQQPPPPSGARASSFTRFLDHTQRRTTVGRTPLDE